MDPVSYLPAVAAFLIAIATTYIITPSNQTPLQQGRFTSIDGLRGYLAFAVFLHHACIWFFHLKGGKWKAPPSNLYTHFGESGVALFFMITGLLFFSKILDSRKREIDWLKLFTSRFMRLVPLYLFCMLSLFAIVAYISGGKTNEPIQQLIKNVLKWLAFTISGAPDINGVLGTRYIVSGVTWSLPYEWFFYFILPALAITVGARPPIQYIAIGFASTALMAIWGPKAHHLLGFLGGIAASILVRNAAFCHFATSKFASCLIVACLTLAVILFPSAYGLAQITLLSIAFSIIAGGNSMFGALTNATSRALGEMAYSIYLLHGIILYAAFNFVFDASESKTFSPEMHWMIVICSTPVLILFSQFTYKFIEKPFMLKTSAATQWIRDRFPQFRFVSQ